MIYQFFPVHECLVCIPDGFLLLLWQQERWPGCGGFSSVQFSHSVMYDSATSWTAAHQASLSITNSQSLLKLMSIELMMPSNHLILCHPLLLLPSIFPSLRVFSNESNVVQVSLGSKITTDGDYRHEIKRHLLLGRKAMTNLRSILKKQKHYFADTAPSSQSYGFSNSQVWMLELDYIEN